LGKRCACEMGAICCGWDNHWYRWVAEIGCGLVVGVWVGVGLGVWDWCEMCGVFCNIWGYIEVRIRISDSSFFPRGYVMVSRNLIT